MKNKNKNKNKVNIKCKIVSNFLNKPHIEKIIIICAYLEFYKSALFSQIRLQLKK